MRKGGISDGITELLVQGGSIKQEERELYAYGIRKAFGTILNLLTIIIIGAVFDMLLCSIVFTAFYIPLRRYAGGFHCNSDLTCYIFSVVQLAVSFSAIKFLPYNDFIYGTVLVWAGICIYLFSPTEDKHKPLEDIEKEVFRTRALLIMTSELLLAIAIFFLGWQTIYMTACFAFLNVSVLILLGRIKSKDFRFCW